MPYVSNAIRTAGSSRPQSSNSGRGRSMYWVSTMPIAPGTAFGADDAIGRSYTRCTAGPGDAFEEEIGGDRLRAVCIEPGPHRGVDIRRLAVASQRDQANRRVQAAQPLRELIPTHSWQPDIEHPDLRSEVDCDLQRFAAGA